MCGTLYCTRLGSLDPAGCTVALMLRGQGAGAVLEWHEVLLSIWLLNPVAVPHTGLSSWLSSST